MKHFTFHKTVRVLLSLAGICVLAVMPARAGTDIWTGSSATSANWNDPANWQSGPGLNAPPAPYDTLDFTGSTGLNATNNYANGTAFDGLTFDGSASAFTLYGNNVLLSGNTNGNNVAIANNSGATETINLGLNLDWGYYTISASGNLNMDAPLTANLGGVADFYTGTVNSTTWSNDATGLIAGLGGAGLMGNSGLGAGTTSFGAALAGFSGLATISGGTVTAYNYSAAQQIGLQPALIPALANTTYPIGADDNTTLNTGFSVVTNTLSTGFTRPAIGLTNTAPFASNAVVNSLIVSNNTGITIGAVVTGTGVPANVTVTSFTGDTIGVTSFTSTAASAGNYTFSQVVNSVTVASAAGIVVGNVFAGTGVPANVTVTNINGNILGVTTFTSTAASAGNYTFAPVVNSVVVASPAGIVMTSPFTGIGVPNGVTVTSINGSTIGLSPFTPTASSLGNYAFATIASEAPANILITPSSAGTAVTISNGLAAGTSTTYGSNNTYVNTITLANNNAAVKYIINLFDPVNGGTLVLGSTNAGTGMYVGGIYAPSLGTVQGITIGDGSMSWITCGPMSGNPIPGEIIIAVNGNNTSNEGELNGVIKDNLSGGKVTVIYAGGGSMFVNTTNSYTGGTYLVKGRIQWNTATAMGLGPVYVSGGDAEASLQNAGTATIVNNFFISPSSSVEADQEGAMRCDGTGNATLTGTITLGGNPASPSGTPGIGDRISSASADVTTLTGQITGPGTLEFFSATGTANVTLANSTNAANNWTGGLILNGTNNDGFDLKLGANNQLGTNNVYMYGLGAASPAARLDLNGFNDTIGALISTSNNATFQVANFGAGPSILTLGAGNQTAYFGGTVQNAVSIVKNGTGTQVFGGATTYTGSTTVNGGVLWLSNSTSTLAANSAITVNSNATLIMTNLASFAMVSNQVWNINGTLLLNGAPVTAGAGASAINMNGGTVSMASFGGTLSAVNLTNATINVASLSGAGNLFTATNFGSGGTNTFNIASVPPVAQYPATFVLVQAANVSGSSSTIVTLPSTAIPPYAYVISNTATQLQLVITNGPLPVTWTGAVPDSGNPAVADWDVGLTTNWINLGVPTNYNLGDQVTFNDKGSNANVYLTTGLAPGSLIVTNNTSNYVFTGPGGLTGPATLIKQGTASLTIANSGANTLSNGVFASGGTLLLQDQNDALVGNLTATNQAHVILDDGGTAMTGSTSIYSNSLVQIGNNDGSGVLPAGAVFLSGGGSLVFDEAQSVAVPNIISGAGALIQSNQSGTLELTSPNTGFTGSAVVDQGILQFGTAGALNATVPIIIQNGATLDINGIAGTNTVAAVQGAGVGGNGAIINSSSTTPTGDGALSFITLTGDTYLGGNGRWDLRGGGSPTLAALTCAGGTPHNLFKIGGNFISIANVSVDSNLANIDISSGTMEINGNTTGLGNPTNTLSVEGPGVLQLYAETNHLNKVLLLNDGSVVNQDSGADIWVGPVTLGTNTSGTAGSIKIQTSAGTSVTFSNVISGIGALTLQTDPGIPIILAGANTYTNTTTISGTGSTELIGSGEILNSAIEIAGGATLDVSQLTKAFTETNSVNVDGTLNLGATVISNFNTLIFNGGTVNMAVNSVGAAPVTVTNLVLNGGALNLTALPLVLVLNQAYPLTQYQNLTNNIGPGQVPNVNFPAGASGSISVDAAHNSIDLTVTATGNLIWNGGSATDNNWSDSANWNNQPIAGSDNLVFAGTTRLANNNDTTADTGYNDIIFAPGAGSFDLNGNAVELTGVPAVVNEASVPETVSVELDFSANTVLQGGSSSNAPLIMGGVLNDSAFPNALYLNGYGSISNNFTTAAGPASGNAFFMTNTSANWTLLDGTNATPSTPNSQAWGFLIEGGTFNFGTPTSAPVFTSTPGNGENDANDNLVGSKSGLIGTFNMVNGSLTLNARLDTGGSTSGANGTVNQTGGTLTINGQFQGDNIGGGVGALNLSGGTFNVVGNTTFVASRGIGSMTVGGTAVANLGLLDVSRGIGLPTQGTVNLNAGGTLLVSGISTATANAASPVTGAAANFNFNGGLLEASGNSATYITDSSTGASLAIPLTVTVKAGGALINDGGFAISVLESLLHDATLTNSRDGGLIKLGAGTLALGNITGLGNPIANTYNGPTVVSNGTLTLGNALSVSNSVSINIAPVATLVASGGTLTLSSNQMLNISGHITGGLTATAASTNLGLVYQGLTNTSAGNATLSLTGAVALQGATEIGIGTATVDSMTTPGTISYGGKLIVTNLSGSTLVAGDTFALFHAGTSYSGSFASVTLPTLGTNLVWQNTLNANGTLTVYAINLPTPAITSVSQSSGNLIISGTNGVANSTFYVLSSTNLTLPLIDWTVISTNTFSGTGTFSVTNPISTTGPSSFFVVETPAVP